MWIFKILMNGRERLQMLTDVDVIILCHLLPKTQKVLYESVTTRQLNT